MLQLDSSITYPHFYINSIAYLSINPIFRNSLKYFTHKQCTRKQPCYTRTAHLLGTGTTHCTALLTGVATARLSTLNSWLPGTQHQLTAELRPSWGPVLQGEGWFQPRIYAVVQVSVMYLLLTNIDGRAFLRFVWREEIRIGCLSKPKPCR